MSPVDYKTHRLSRSEARKQIAKIMNHLSGKFYFSHHTRIELENDDLTTGDALNVLKSPDPKINIDGEFERGSYRYRLETNHLMVVIAFQEDGEALTVVTAWDKRNNPGGAL